MPYLPFHPAPGVGIMLPGMWTVPQNPITAGLRRQPHLGEMMPAFFPVPENPLMEALTGCGGCSGCSGRCSGRCEVGLGQLEYVTGWWEDLKAGDTTAILIAAGVAVGAVILIGGGKRR